MLFYCLLIFPLVDLQEGLARPSRAKAKLHLGAIAKTALRFSFLRFKAKSSTDLETEDNEVEETKRSSTNSLSLNLPNGFSKQRDRNKNVEHFHITEADTTQRRESSSEEIHEKRVRKRDDMADQRLTALETRISRIENEMKDFRSSLNSQIDRVLLLMTELKSDITHKEIVTQIDLCNNEGPFRPDTDSETATTSF